MSGPGGRPRRRDWYRSTAAFLERTRIAAGNHWIKLRRLERCCGNDGQPGC